jgi:hypothetical protein
MIHTPQQRHTANYAESEGRARYRQGKPVTDCPWSDSFRALYFQLGWNAESRKRRNIRRRRALGSA